MTSQRPSPWAILFAITRMSLRQALNRSLLFGRKPKPMADRAGNAKRVGSAGKRGFSWTQLVLIIFVPAFLAQGILMSSLFVSRASHLVESQTSEAVPAVESDGVDDEDLSAAVREAIRRNAEYQKATAGRDVWPDGEMWPTSRTDEQQARRVVAALLLLLCAANAMVGLGMGNRDLGAVEWKFEWLFSFPAPNYVLLFAKLTEYAIYNPFSFFTCFPVMLVVSIANGASWGGAIVHALAGTLCLSTLLAAVRLFGETFLRKRCSRSQIKNLQATFTVLGLVLFYFALYLVLPDPAPPLFERFAQLDLRWVDYSPTTLPLAAAFQRPSMVFGLLVATVPLALVGAGLTALLVRNGLVTAGGPYSGVRQTVGDTTGSSRLRGIVGKEVRLLLRDRNFLVRTLVLPFIIVGFQVLANPGMLEGAAEKPQHAAMLAFGVVAYMLAGSALVVLVYESRALWLLYTFPQSLASLMLRKTRLWAVIAMVYVAVLGEGLLALGKTSDWSAHGFVLLAVVAIGIFAFVAAGIGTLGCDPLAQDERKRLKSGPVLFYMFLASQFAYAMYAPSVWNKFVFVALSALVAYALWQRVSERIEFLLDSEARPKPRVALSDGLIVTMAFFVVQGLLSQLLVRKFDDADLLLAVVIAYGTAGLIVTAVASVVLWARKIPDLLAALGLARCRWRLAQSMATGLLLGIVSGAFAFAYLKLGKSIPWFADQIEQVPAGGQAFAGQGWIWMIVLAVAIAPPCEEFLFRSLIYRGLRNSSGFLLSAVSSAAVFALVHPPLSFVPVFVLGLLCAWGFEKSGNIATSITAHVCHNTIAVSIVMFGWV